MQNIMPDKPRRAVTLKVIYLALFTKKGCLIRAKGDDKMTKRQYKNLNHSFRWMRRKSTYQIALAWIKFYNSYDAYIIFRIFKEASDEG